jgi:lipoyl(octanoyl) transferase
MITFKDLGLIDYKKAWDYQEILFNKNVYIKKNNIILPLSLQKKTINYLLFCEHPPVFTLGKSGSENNLLINKKTLEKENISYYKINRGGDITFHGPGQIVGYPIFDLENFSLNIREYIYKLEEVIILTLNDYNIKAERLKEATGVWLDSDDNNKTRKICSIGVRISRWITMHGFAFNVNTNLKYYELINPCGFTDKAVTSMEKELGEKQNIREVKNKLRKYFKELF